MGSCRTNLAKENAVLSAAVMKLMLVALALCVLLGSTLAFPEPVAAPSPLALPEPGPVAAADPHRRRGGRRRGGGGRRRGFGVPVYYGGYHGHSHVHVVPRYGHVDIIHHHH